MLNSITMKLRSGSFDEDEKKLVIKLLNYFKNKFENGAGSYLETLNLEKIKFNWCFAMSSLNKNKDNSHLYGETFLTFGAWSPLWFNEIFFVPSVIHYQFLNYLKNKNKHIKNLIESMENINVQKKYENELNLRTKNNLQMIPSYVFSLISRTKNFGIDNFNTDDIDDDEHLMLEIIANRMDSYILERSFFNEDKLYYTIYDEKTKKEVIKLNFLGYLLNSNDFNNKTIFFHKSCIKDFDKFLKILFLLNTSLSDISFFNYEDYYNENKNNNQYQEDGYENGYEIGAFNSINRWMYFNDNAS